MSSSDIAIRVDRLGKAYTIRHNQSDHVTMAEQALERLKHPLRRSEREEFWALRGVSFEVRPGEVLGVIGRNGAGKSTLLKLLTRITGPTEGQIDLWGRVGSLLEVGTGFHPELTGRENVYLNGSILGMTRREIERQFDAIVEFANVERFLDTPVKRYSSGMYVRLAFAVAAHLETEILLVDEVLAVGDQEFQKKCLTKMHDVATTGRTVLFVSHQMQSVTQLCDRCIVLAGGQLSFEGSTAEAVHRYLAEGAAVAGTARPEARPGSVHVQEVVPAKASFSPSEPKQFRAVVEAGAELVPGTWVSFHIVDDLGAVVGQCDSRLSLVTLDRPGRYEVDLTVRTPWLKDGRYTVDTFVCHSAVLDSWQGACGFEVTPDSPYPTAAPPDSVGAVAVLSDFTVSVAASPGGGGAGGHRVGSAPTP